MDRSTEMNRIVIFIQLVVFVWIKGSRCLHHLLALDSLATWHQRGSWSLRLKARAIKI